MTSIMVPERAQELFLAFATQLEINLKIRMARELAQARLAQSPRERIEPVSPCVFGSVLQLHARSLEGLIHLNSQEIVEDVSK